MPEIRFQLDEHMPHAVAQSLRQHGIDVMTATDAGLLHTPDAELLAHAYAAGRVVVTQDRDCLRLSRQGHPHAGIVYSEQGTRSIGQIVDSLILIHAVLTPAEMAGRVEFL
jgi:predicted nuclease of predicted toxin-antitoxin system